MRKSRKRGFTLLEVLLVIAILGILAAFVVPKLFNIGEKAKIDAARAAVGPTGTIATMLELYAQQLGAYPDTDQGLLALVERPSELDEDDERWTGYIKNASELRDPWNNEYQYKSPGDYHEDGYDLWSMGPDGEDGTDDDVVNWKQEK